MDGVVDEALGVLSGTGPEYEAFGGRISLANHGPMVVDALRALDCAGTVVEWAQRYRPRLDARPERRERITASAWRDALGDMARVRDWADYFDEELAEAPWTTVVNRWYPRLTPGMVGGVHGAIRTAHAVRSLGNAVTPARTHELAEGLAFWAAQYAGLPRRSYGPSALLPSQAIPQLEQLDVAERAGWTRFTDPIARLADLPSFAAATDLVDTNGDGSTVDADLATAFARILISNNPRVNPRALCHGLTGGTATSMIRPYVSADAAEASLRYGWQTAAAFYCAIVLEPPADATDAPAPTIAEIIGEALECPDEHGIKVADACLRAYAVNSDPVLLTAALKTTRRLNEVGLDLY